MIQGLGSVRGSFFKVPSTAKESFFEAGSLNNPISIFEVSLEHPGVPRSGCIESY